MTAAEDKIAQLASLLVEQLPAAIGQTVIDNGGQLLPHAASSAQREIDAEAPFVGRSQHPVLDTFSLVHVRLAGSMHNLVAIGRLLDGGPLDPPCGVLARASLESAAVAAWLLGEPGDVKVRVARGLAQRLYEQQEDAGILRGIADDPERARIISGIHNNVEEIASACRAVDIEVKRTKKGRVYLPEAPAPTASAAVMDLLGDAGLIAYRLLCGSTHGSTNTAIRSMTEAPVTSAIDGLTVMMPGNDVLALVPPLGTVLQGFYTVNDRRFEALGWRNVQPWAAWKLQIMNLVVEVLPDLENN